MARQPKPGDEAGHQATRNQARHEPVPASRQDERPQAAAQRSEDVQQDIGQQRRGGAEDRSPALGSLAAGERIDRPAPVSVAATNRRGTAGLLVAAAALSTACPARSSPAG